MILHRTIKHAIYWSIIICKGIVLQVSGIYDMSRDITKGIYICTATHKTTQIYGLYAKWQFTLISTDFNPVIELILHKNLKNHNTSCHLQVYYSTSLVLFYTSRDSTNGIYIYTATSSFPNLSCDTLDASTMITQVVTINPLVTCPMSSLLNLSCDIWDASSMIKNVTDDFWMHKTTEIFDLCAKVHLRLFFTNLTQLMNWFYVEQ